MGNITRKNSTPIKVYCLPSEHDEIEVLAHSTGHTMSSYLLSVGLGYRTTSILDNKRVEELICINADLGRLGGLLKLWLTDDPRTVAFGEATIKALLGQIEETQGRMRDVIRLVVLPRTKR
jgi:hypothetical protein